MTLSGAIHVDRRLKVAAIHQGGGESTQRLEAQLTIARCGCALQERNRLSIATETQERLCGPECGTASDRLIGARDCGGEVCECCAQVTRIESVCAGNDLLLCVPRWHFARHGESLRDRPRRKARCQLSGRLAAGHEVERLRVLGTSSSRLNVFRRNDDESRTREGGAVAH